MKGYPTTFLGLFDQPTGARPRITQVEIPIIQRDFAQGRPDHETTAIRERFLDAVVQALTSSQSMGLDFVYGDVREGILRPLDGQQRLTTLFLLHWYVASRAGVLEPSAPWLRFSYETRLSARDFTEAMAVYRYRGGAESPSTWITDQPWYVYPWRQDPTIASMLVVLDAIHERLYSNHTDFQALWERLAARPGDARQSAIWFLFLPVIDRDSGEDLYIKMNSRGKPLTAFEVFKADFESIMKAADPHRYEHLVKSMDGAWTDLLWRYERRSEGDFSVDEEFMRYLAFIIDICEWRDAAPDRRWRDKETYRERSIEERAQLAFADSSNANAPWNRDFFFHAFDTWVETDPAEELGRLFTANGSGAGPLPLFSATADLFGGCIARYGSDFSAQETLLLYAVLLARQSARALEPERLAPWLRSLRNLTAAFLDRDRYMSSYVASTEKLILLETFEDLEGFRAEWVADEAFKQGVLGVHSEVAPALHVIEDNTLIRGRVMAFDIGAEAIARRAEAFAAVSDPQLRDKFGAALLAKGDYSRDVDWGGQRRQLGNSAKDDTWTEILTTGSRVSLASVRDPLMLLLDDFADRRAAGAPSNEAVLDAFLVDWLAEREAQRIYDWRYYLVRYVGARSSFGNGYYHGRYDGKLGGFSCESLRILHGRNYSAYYSDGLLRAAWVDADLGVVADEPTWWRRTDRGLTLKNSHIEIRCHDDGFEVVLPTDDRELAETVSQALTLFDTSEPLHVVVPRHPVDGRLVDDEDRVQLCVRLVRELAAAGL